MRFRSVIIKLRTKVRQKENKNTRRTKLQGQKTDDYLIKIVAK